MCPSFLKEVLILILKESFNLLLTDAVKKRYKNIDDRIIESTIIDWFRRASDRVPKIRDEAK